MTAARDTIGARQQSWGNPAMHGAPGKLAYTPLERVRIGRPVNRIDHISKACENRVVLDLGAMDETAFLQKRASGSWLHEEIARVASRVIGVDSSEFVPHAGLPTGPNSVIVKGGIFDLGSVLEKTGAIPDIVVAGELIEHLENPLAFLRFLKTVPQLRGARLLLSTPNATALHNCLIGLTRRESTHHDHLCILSFKTLSTLLARAGYEEWEITPYHADFAEMRLRNRGLRRKIVVAGEMAIRLAERMFPMLSFGYIVETTV